MATVDVVIDVQPDVDEVPEKIVTIQPGAIQSWACKGRSAQFKLENARFTPYPLPMYVVPRFDGSATGRSWSQWLVEPLTNQPAGLFMGLPMLCHRRDGSYYTRWAYNQSGNTIEEAYGDYVAGRFKPAVFEGKRNCNATTGYTTYVHDPTHNGWWGFDKITGWMFHVHGDGAIWTAAGDETPVEDSRIYYGERKRTGKFDKFWNMTTDFRMYPENHSILFVCDRGNNRITRTDWMRTNSITDSLTETYVEIPGVYGFDIAPDGTIFAVSRTTGKLYEVTPNKAIKEIGTGLTDAHRVRLTSENKFVWGAHDAKNLYEWTGSNRLIGSIAGASQAWWDFAVDVTGSVGPKDDILTTVSHTNPGAPMRFSFDGSYKSTAPNGSPLRTGRVNRSGYGNAVNDGAMHYGWGIAIHVLEARFVVCGFGDIAHAVWRRVRSSGDGSSFNYNGYIAGRSQHQWGDSTFNSMETLHGPRGFGYTGLKNFDELAHMADADLDAYIKSGMEGTLNPRTFSAQNLRDYRYYIRMNSVRGVTENITY